MTLSAPTAVRLVRFTSVHMLFCSITCYFVNRNTEQGNNGRQILEPKNVCTDKRVFCSLSNRNTVQI